MILSNTLGSANGPLLAGNAGSESKSAIQTGTSASAHSSSSLISISQQGLSLLSAEDTRAPKAVKFTPRDGQRNISISSSISISFSETIKAGSGNITIKDAEGNVVETFDVASSDRLSIRGKRVKIDPTDNLAYGTRYFVTFDSGAITDLAGNAFQDTGKFDFTTKQERKPPKVTAFYPADRATDVSPTQNLYVTFSEEIKRGSGYILLKESSGKIVERYRVQNSSNLTFSGNTLVIDPSAKLDNSKKYVVEFAPGSVKDLAGNQYKGSKGYDFKTAATDTAPVVPANAPENSDPAQNFNIEVAYSGDSAYQSYFDQAKAIWERIITVDLPDVGAIDDLKITASVAAIDGAGGILGQAGPTNLRSGTYLPYQGQMTFDSADVANMAAAGTLLRVILHEMGHVLGLGTLWGAPYHSFNTTPGQYTGAQGLAAYKAMSGGNPAATFVPLEDGGGAGTANVHWEESIFGDELMTGFAEGDGNMPLSILTIAALQDLGYEVDVTQAENYTVSA